MGESGTNSDARWESYCDSLKLDSQELEELLILRNKLAAASNDPARRTSKRLRISGHLWIPAELKGPAGELSRLRVYPLDISTGGMSFLVGLFVHPGSEWTMSMYVAEGEMVKVTGKTARCEFIKGRAHEVGLVFDDKFDMGLLIPPGAISKLGVASTAVSQAPKPSPGVPASTPVPSPNGHQPTSAPPESLAEIRSLTSELVKSVAKFAARVNTITDKVAGNH